MVIWSQLQIHFARTSYERLSSLVIHMNLTLLRTLFSVVCPAFSASSLVFNLDDFNVDSVQYYESKYLTHFLFRISVLSISTHCVPVLV